MLFPERPCRLVLRRTEDWSRLSPDQHLQLVSQKLTHLGPQRFGLLVRNLKLWNTSYQISYPMFRAELSKIAQTSWKATRIPVGAHPKAILFPTDDDDWYAPNLREHVLEAFDDPTVQHVVWQCWRYFLTPDNLLWEGKNFDIHQNGWGYPASNGYALRPQSPWILMHNHTHVNLAHQKHVLIDKPLSVWVMTPSSLWTLSNKELPAQIERSPTPKLPKELKWAETLFEQSLTLKSKLEQPSS